jgi:hypothetical protein
MVTIRDAAEYPSIFSVISTSEVNNFVPQFFFVCLATNGHRNFFYYFRYQCPSLKADSRLASEDICCISWNLKMCIRIPHSALHYVISMQSTPSHSDPFQYYPPFTPVTQLESYL